MPKSGANDLDITVIVLFGHKVDSKVHLVASVVFAMFKKVGARC